MKYTELIKKLKFPFFSRQDLKLLGIKILNYQFSLWQKQGHIIKLKNGLYAFADRLEDVIAEEIAGQLYAPSYVSLESALSSFGFIPEMVFSITSVTPKTTRNFKNKLGNYIYHHIQPPLFFGYQEMKSKNAPYLLAEPEKALLDFIYLNRDRLKTKSAIEEMRFNWHEMKNTVSKRKLLKYLSFYKNKSVQNICKSILEKI